MILDNRTLLSDAQAITATENSDNVIDLGAMGVTRDGVTLTRKGNFSKIPLLIQITEAFNTLTSLDIVVQTDNDEAFGSATELMRMTLTLAQLTLGKIAPMEMVPRGPLDRYFRLRYEVTGSNPTLGKITAGIPAAVDGAYRG